MVKNLPANIGDVISIPGQEGLLGKEMATHSSILAWEIPWTEKSGGLQSMRSHRVSHNLAITLYLQILCRNNLRSRMLPLFFRVASYCFCPVLGDLGPSESTVKAEDSLNCRPWVSRCCVPGLI